MEDFIMHTALPVFLGIIMFASSVFFIAMAIKIIKDECF